MSYGLRVYSGTSPKEEVVFSTEEGDTFLKKMYKASFGPTSGTTTTVISSIPAGLNRTNSVICVSVTDSDQPIVGNARAEWTGPESLDGEGEITIPKCFENAGNITGFIEVLQYEGMELSPDTFGLLVTDPAGDLIIDHDTVVWGIQYGGTLEDQGWFGYTNNGGEYAEYRIQELPKDTFAVDQPFGLAVKMENPYHWVIQPDFLTDGDEFYTAVRFHRMAGQNSDLHFIIVVPADETNPPMLTDDAFGMEIYGPTGDLGWSTRWHQAVVKHIHEMNQGWEHMQATPLDDYNLTAGYDGVSPPVAYFNSPQGYSESAQSLRSEGRWANSEQGTLPKSTWPWGRTLKSTHIYTLFSTGTGYIQYYKGMKTLDGVNQGLEGGGLHSWATRIAQGDQQGWTSSYVVDMFRLGDGPTPSGAAQYCARALPGYHATGHVLFLGSTYVGPVLPPSTFCLTGRSLPESTDGAPYTRLDGYYLSNTGLIPTSHTEFTLVFCIKPSISVVSGSGAMVEIKEGPDYVIGLWIQENGGFEWYCDLNGGGWAGLIVTSGALDMNQWNSVYLTASINETAQTFTAYLWINGSQVASYVDEPTGGTGAQSFKSHAIDNTPWFGGTSHSMGYDISYIWCDDQYLDPTTYHSVFFDTSGKPQNIGVNGEQVIDSTIPLNYFPDGSPIYQYGSLVDTEGFSDWWVSNSGYVPESLTNPTGCPQKLDGGDKGPLCVTGRTLDESGLNYYMSDTGYIDHHYEKFTFVCCLYPKENTADGYFYSTTPNVGGNMPFFMGLKANGNFWIGWTTDDDATYEWNGDILTQDTWNSVYITAYFRSGYAQILFEIWVDGKQKVRTFIGSTADQFLAHNTFGSAYLGRGPVGADGVNIDISYFFVDDWFWYMGDYWPEFFDIQDRPLPAGENSDEITGQTPIGFYPSGTPVKYVEVSDSTWEVFGRVAESKTNPSPCLRKNDGGDGFFENRGGKRFGYGGAMHDFVQWYELFVSDVGVQEFTLVFCIRPLEYPTTTEDGWQTPIMSLLTEEYGTIGFWYDSVNTQLTFEVVFSGGLWVGVPATKLILNQWNSVMISVILSGTPGNWSTDLKLWINGVEEASKGISGYQNFNFYEFCVGAPLGVWNGTTDIWVDSAKFDLSYFWADSIGYEPSVYWNEFFENTANMPKLSIGYKGDGATNTVPQRFYPGCHFTRNQGTLPDGVVYWEEGKAIVSPARDTDIIPDSPEDPWSNTLTTGEIWEDTELAGNELMLGEWYRSEAYGYEYNYDDYNYLARDIVDFRRYNALTQWQYSTNPIVKIQFFPDDSPVDDTAFPNDGYAKVERRSNYPRWISWVARTSVSTGQYLVKLSNVWTNEYYWDGYDYVPYGLNNVGDPRISINGQKWNAGAMEDVWYEASNFHLQCIGLVYNPGPPWNVDYEFATTRMTGWLTLAKNDPNNLGNPLEESEHTIAFVCHAQGYSPYS